MCKPHHGAIPILAGILYLVLVCVLCSISLACGPAPTYETSHGLEIYDDTVSGVDRADVEYITAVALELLPVDADDLRGLPVTLRQGECGYMGLSGWVALSGSFAEGSICVWAARAPCFARTAYGHELLHLLTWIRTRGDSNGSHQELKKLNKTLWETTVAGMCTADNGDGR